jgi:hypothetical protein
LSDGQQNSSTACGAGSDGVCRGSVCSEECVRIVSMATEKPKPDTTKVQWVNQVVKTADGRLIVRGVDVPVSGWKSVTLGKTPSSARSVVARAAFAVPSPITTKREALATAKRAGLATLSAYSEKAARSDKVGAKTSMASKVLSRSSGGKKAAISAKRGTKPDLLIAALSGSRKK